MLSLWRLTLLCGLFISPSCCLLDSLSPALSNVQSTLKKETPLVTDKLQVLGQDLTGELEKLKVTPIGQVLNHIVGDAGDLVGSTVNTVVSKLENALGVKVLDTELLKVKAELSSDAKSVNLRVPVSATVALKVSPIIPDLIKVKVGLDILRNINAGKDAISGASTLVLGDCSSDSATVSISLLDGLLGLENYVLKSVDSLLKKLLPIAVEKQACPLIKNLVNLLGINVAGDLLGNLQTQNLNLV